MLLGSRLILQRCIVSCVFVCSLCVVVRFVVFVSFVCCFRSGGLFSFVVC